MSRDLDPPVRERDAAPPPGRRGSRRDQAPVDPYDDADPYPPTVSRVMRDEHRPRRGTLPDRRMLRRDTPIDYSAEFTDEAAESSPDAGAGGGAVRRADTGAWDDAALGARQDDPAESVASGAGTDARSPEAGAAAEHRELEPAARRADAVRPERGESQAAVAAGTQDVSGAVEPTGRDQAAAGRSETTPKRRLPALPALEPGDSVREPAPATGVVAEPAGRGPEPSEGDRMERKRSRD
ncbi:hypothetical protein ACWELJ_33950, partial [Nocardia sp. NPDC004582]